MNNSRTLGKIGAGIAAVSLGLLGVGITATPALADTIDDISTSTLDFQGIDDSMGYIEDVLPYDAATSIRGWSTDAYDGFPNQFRISENDTDANWYFTADSTVPTINPGGSSTIVLTGSTGDTFETDYTVTLTLSLTGNYAQWSYAITGGDTSGLAIEIEGDLGSDSGSTFIENGNTLISTDGGDANNSIYYFDPVIGWAVDTDGTFDGFDVTDEDGDVRASASGASTFTLTSVFVDYEPLGGYDKALALVTSLVPTLADKFGDAYDVQSTPLFVLEPVTLTLGTPVNQLLSGTFSQELVDAGYLGTTPGTIAAVITGVPEGLELTFSQDPTSLLPVLTLTGTPLASGEFAADVTVYRVFSEDEGGEGEGEEDPFNDGYEVPGMIGTRPLSAPVAITVPAVDVPVVPVVPAAPAAVKPALAATGFDGMMVIGFGGLAAAAGILLVATTRRRRRA